MHNTIHVMHKIRNGLFGEQVQRTQYFNMSLLRSPSFPERQTQSAQIDNQSIMHNIIHIVMDKLCTKEATDYLVSKFR